MTIILTQSDFRELYETAECSQIEIAPGLYEEKCQIPELPNLGQSWIIDLWEGSGLIGESWRVSGDLTFSLKEREHEVEMCLWIPECKSNSRYTLFGSGIAPQEIWQSPANSPGVHLIVYFEPDLLRMLYGGISGELPPELQLLIQDYEWQKVWRDRPITSTMMNIVRDILACPYQGLTKQMYLQGKALELLATQIELLKEDPSGRFNDYPKGRTREKIYQARDLLRHDWENPPSVVELAQQLEISDRTLRRGFKQIFGTTVISYLIARRLEKAQQLLREQYLTVAQVSRLVGYSSPSRFAAAFKQKFSISPSECYKGKKA